MARGAPLTPQQVLAAHQFPESGEGRCITCPAWGLAVSEMDENQQMAEHQMEMLHEAGFYIARQVGT